MTEYIQQIPGLILATSKSPKITWTGASKVFAAPKIATKAQKAASRASRAAYRNAIGKGPAAQHVNG